MLLTRILELCKAKFRYVAYDLPCEDSVKKHLDLLGAEGKEISRSMRALAPLGRQGKHQRRPVELWSDNGMGLFGIYAHGIADWSTGSEKALIGLVACESERHTAENVKKWTETALTEIGLTVKGLLSKPSDA